jgi:L-ascorbate metabolism protein UlaG (beta-lactamase superfamily)
MDIKYLGHSSFFIRGKSAKIVTDPFNSSFVGLPFPKTEADIVIISHQHNDHNDTSKIDGTPLIIDIPGEYEKCGIRVYGFSSYHDDSQGSKRGLNTIYKIEIDDINLLHLGDLGHILSDEIIEEIDVVDILFIPVGGHYTIDAAVAEQLVQQIEPSIVIPMHYSVPKMKPDLAAKLAPVSEFLKKRGVAAAEPVKKLSIAKADLTEETKVIVMEKI